MLSRSGFVDCRWQNCNEQVSSREHFSMYIVFSQSNYGIPIYLQLELDRHLKFVMTKVWYGISDFLQIQELMGNILRPLRGNARDDKIHFVLFCPFLKIKKFININILETKVSSTFHCFSLKMKLHTENCVLFFIIHLKPEKESWRQRPEEKQCPEWKGFYNVT